MELKHGLESIWFCNCGFSARAWLIGGAEYARFTMRNLKNPAFAFDVIANIEISGFGMGAGVSHVMALATNVMNPQDLHEKEIPGGWDWNLSAGVGTCAGKVLKLQKHIKRLKAMSNLAQAKDVGKAATGLYADLFTGPEAVAQVSQSSPGFLMLPTFADASVELGVFKKTITLLTTGGAFWVQNTPSWILEISDSNKPKPNYRTPLVEKGKKCTFRMHGIPEEFNDRKVLIMFYDEDGLEDDALKFKRSVQIPTGEYLSNGQPYMRSEWRSYGSFVGYIRQGHLEVEELEWYRVEGAGEDEIELYPMIWEYPALLEGQSTASISGERWKKLWLWTSPHTAIVTLDDNGWIKSSDNKWKA